MWLIIIYFISFLSTTVDQRGFPAGYLTNYMCKYYQVKIKSYSFCFFIFHLFFSSSFYFLYFIPLDTIIIQSCKNYYIQSHPINLKYQIYNIIYPYIFFQSWSITGNYCLVQFYLLFNISPSTLSLLFFLYYNTTYYLTTLILPFAFPLFLPKDYTTYEGAMAETSSQAGDWYINMKIPLI